MAQRRMFSKEITNSSDFQMMSPSAQALYFHIGMNSDDDGFCEAFTIVRMTESKPDDLSALQQRGFIYLVDSKVCIVKDWHTNNDIRVDRYSRSKYLDKPQYADIYGIIMEDKIKHLSRYKAMLPSGSTDGSTQVRLGEDRIINTSVAIAPQVVEVLELSEESKKPSAKPKYPHSKEVFALWPSAPRNWALNTTQLRAAENLYEEQGIEEIKACLDWYEKHKDDDFCPRITSPYDLDSKWAKLGDFYDKKHA